MWRYRRVWFLLGLMAVTAMAGGAWVLTQVPLPPEAALPQTTIIYDAKGNQIATLHGQENRFPVKIDQVPPIVQSALIAAEDRKFLKHGGIDPLGIVRATWADVRHKGATQGGSTITQQYVKQVYVGSDPTLWRKLREAVIAIKLERKLDKRQILERYLNTVYFGRGAYGIQAASRTWFEKDVGDLGLKEAAYLVGLIRSPSGGDMASDPALAYELRTFVLQAMVETKAITPAQMAEVEAIKLESYVAPRTELDSTVSLQGIGAEYYVQYVREQLEATYSEDFVLRQGLRVQTSLDPELQRQAYDAVYGLLDEPATPPAPSWPSTPTAGWWPWSGAGTGRSPRSTWPWGRAAAAAGRQGGSTFKPFALAAAVKDGYSLESSFRGPAKIVLPKADRGNDWEVTNYERASFGQVNLIDATVESVNTVYAQLVDSLGPDKVVEMAQAARDHVGAGAGGVDRPRHPERVGDGHGQRLLHPGPRRHPLRPPGDHPGHHERHRPPRQPAPGRTGAGEGAGRPGQLRPRAGRGPGLGHRRPGRSTPRSRARPAPPRTSATPGSWATPASLTVAVWMGYPEGQSQQLLNVHGVKKVNGGSLPARIFQRFVSGLPPENDDTATPAPDFTGRALSPIVRYTTPAPPSTAPSGASEPTTATPSDGSVTLSGPTTTRRPRRRAGRHGRRHPRRPRRGHHQRRLPGHGQHHARRPPHPPRDVTTPTWTLPPGVTLPGG